MLKPFVRLFNLSDNRQVLLAREFNQEDKTFDVRVTTEAEGMRVSINHQFEVEEDCDKAFDGYTDEKAERFYDNVVKKLAETETEG